MCDKELLVGYIYDELDQPSDAPSSPPALMRRVPRRAERPSRGPHAPGDRGRRRSRSSASRSSAGRRRPWRAGGCARRRGGSPRQRCSCSRWPRRSPTSRSGTAATASPSAPGGRACRPRRQACRRSPRSPAATRRSASRAADDQPAPARPRVSRRDAAGDDVDPCGGGPDAETDVMRQVRQLLADSEKRQERELALRITRSCATSRRRAASTSTACSAASPGPGHGGHHDPPSARDGEPHLPRRPADVTAERRPGSSQLSEV